ncbi:MAG: pyridoxamine 5'-phosphate oxidase family protein [Paracoccaceae bacterium]
MKNEQESSAVWSDDLVQILARIWACLRAGPAPQTLIEGMALGRLATLGTIGADGGPELRQVMLRAVNESRGLIDIHTDSATAKCAELAANPKASVLLWRADLNLQMRFKGRAEIVTGQEAAPLWQAVPAQARPNYGVMPAPGSAISAPGNFSRVADPARFAVLRISIEAIDAVILAEPQHRRASFERRDRWRGQWLAP